MAKSDEKVKRKEAILRLLSEAGDKWVSIRQMIDEIELIEGKRRAKSTISENIDKLIEEGYPIEKGGVKGFRIAEDDTMLQYDDISGYEMLTDKMVENWLLLVLLNEEKGFFTFNRIIEKHFRDKIDMITDNETGLRQRLDTLEENGFITKSKKEDISVLLTEKEKAVGNGTCYYMLSESASVLTLISEDDAFEFGYFYTDSGYAGELRDVLGSINAKLDFVFTDFPTECSGTYRTTGRVNKISEDLMEKLESFLKLPFKSKAVIIKQKGLKGSKTIKTGIIVFSIETNMLYLIGEEIYGPKGGSNKYVVVRFDSIIKATESNKPNNVYESAFYMELLKKMWGVTPGEPEEVEIHFENMPYVRDKVKKLQKLRGETALVTFPPVEDVNSWIIYKDRIIGLNAAMPYIRSMGSSAVVVRPERIRNLILEKTKETIDNYRELHEKWEKEQEDTKGSRN